MIKKIFLKLIKLYQLLVSPFLGKHCRFYPSCSEYAASSIKKYGILAGGSKAFKRILKCSSWNLGGVDLP
ncbi:MAG: membrane protein insertion efficiency factor YidD [bacterium]|nr:membrane protein insertion efficiency factor YidD [bacterium]